MKKINLITALFALAIIGFASCKKSDVNNPQDYNNAADLQKIQKFFDEHKPKYESFTLDASTGGTITLASGTKITFAPNSFLKNGVPVIGNVNISALDILKPSSMILGDKPTVTNNGEMLESFGEIKVDAQQNGVALQLNNGNTDGAAGAAVALAVGPGKQNQRDGFPIWDGDTTISQTTSGYNHENQMVSVTTQVTIKKGMDWTEIPGQMGYTDGTTSYFNLDSLGQWRNCDALYNDTRPKTTVLGYFGNLFNATNSSYMGQEPSMLFYKTKGTNTLVKLYNTIFNPIAGKEGFLSYQNTMPIGSEGTFLAITTKNNKFYAEMRDVTIGSPASGNNYVGYTFNFTEVSETQLLNLINQMNTK
ncbi:MAG: hypothetical protein ACK5NK_01230 [Niabella sp.]